ncbi:MAG: ABC transporter permease subunit [Gammaproteobacteria bacterium]|nr:ABC transporter permease subunit [Gammaproteobacteria bacterium]
MIFTLASRELRSLFLSPLAWSILAIVQFLIGYIFLGQVDLYLQVQAQLSAMQNPPGLTELIIAPVFSNAAIILLLIIPLLTMRLIAEEKRNQTLALLLSAPISMTEIILGKYVGVMGFVFINLFFVLLMPISLLSGGNLDIGMIASGLIALTLLLASFTAAGVYMSTITSQPTIAAVSTFGLLLLLWVIDWAVNINSNQATGVTPYLSILKHYQPLINGVFKSSDVTYYLLFITTFLVLSIRRLHADRLQH